MSKGKSIVERKPDETIEQFHDRIADMAHENPDIRVYIRGDKAHIATSVTVQVVIPAGPYRALAAKAASAGVSVPQYAAKLMVDHAETE